MSRQGCVLLLLGSLAACGGSDSGSGNPPTSPGNPTPPGNPTATSISVQLRDVVLVGTNATATATATLSNGQTQPVTSGFSSDAASVATVTGAGVVTGVSNGEATITAASGGVQGTKRIRVAPNYEGTWQGTQVITSCAATGVFAGVCEEEGGIIGDSFPVGMKTRHPTDLNVSGEFTIEEFQFPTFTTGIEGDGTIRFSSSATSEGVKLDVAWQVNSPEPGRVTGTIRERYSVPGVADGEVVFESSLSGFTRTGPAIQAVRPAPGGPVPKQRVQAYVRR